MLRVIVTVALFGGALLACTTASKTYGPSGATAYSINCSGPRDSWSDCYEKAGDVCGASGYTMVSTSDAEDAATARFGGRSVYDYERAMLIECKR